MYPGRTTPELVAGIREIDPTIADITMFIDISNEMVTELCAVNDTNIPPANIYGYTDHRLTLIETWLAAHFYTIRDRMAAQEQAGPVQESLPAILGLGLRNTTYGQQAMRLDTGGALAILDNAQTKYAKVPKALLTGVTIGVHAMVDRCTKKWYGYYGGGCGPGY